MGGRATKEKYRFASQDLQVAVDAIREDNSKRADEVSAFYVDLEASIKNVATKVRVGGHACYVVGNRRVKGIELPTDVAVRCAFEEHGFRWVDTFLRSIPNKRMPAKNSPSNKAGALEATMTAEYIVVMEKI